MVLCVFNFLMKIQSDLQYIKEDISTVQKRSTELYRAKERCSVKQRMLVDDSFAEKTLPLLIDKHNKGITTGAHNLLDWMGSASSLNKVDVKDQASSQRFRSKDAGGSDSAYDTNSGLAVARKRRFHAHVSCLAYFHIS